MKSERPAAVAKFAAFLKSSFLNNLDKLHKYSARKAVSALKLAVAEKILAERTLGAFGSAVPPRAPGRASKLMRYISSPNRVRGY